MRNTREVKEEMKIKCQHDDCGYQWETKVDPIKRYVTCPACMRKTHREIVV